jgi:hypothetical protein
MRSHSFETRIICGLLALSILFTSCTSTTLIRSSPSGAKVYLDGEPVGTTPYTHRDTKVVGSTTVVKLEKEGYETLNTTFTRDEEVDIGAVVCGFFALVPFLWTMKYKPVRTYELVPINAEQTFPSKPASRSTKTKAERLREFKQLLDEKAITEEEYEKEKKKILEEDEN